MRQTRPVLEALEGRQLLAAIVVTNVIDSGVGTLRQAILDANASEVPSTIDFAIAGAGVHVISPLSGLPSITTPLVIDGTTQPGYSGSPLIAIDGSNAGSTSGLSFFANGGSVSGLAIERFAADGIQAASGLVARDNFIGVDPSGAEGAGNEMNGIAIFGGSGVIIGGDATGANVIAGNKGSGVDLEFTSDARVSNNFIGTDSAGRTAIGNALDGVFIGKDSSGTFVGSNVISNNGSGAISDLGTGTVLDGNVETNNGTQVATVVVTTATTSASALIGQPLTFVYTLTNQGLLEATNVTLDLYSQAFVDNFDLVEPPPVFQLVSAATSQGTIVTGASLNGFAFQPFAQIGTLAPGASASVIVKAAIANPGVDTLQAKVTADQPTAAPNAVTGIPITGLAPSDIAVTALPIPAVVKVGQPLAFTFLITNRDAAVSVLPTFNLNLAGLDGSSVVSISTSQGTFGMVPGTTDLYVGDLSVQDPRDTYASSRIGLTPGASATVTLVIIPRTSGKISAALASSASLDMDPNPSNNLAVAGARAKLLPTVTRTTLIPENGSIDLVSLVFDAPLWKATAIDLRNYRLTVGGVRIGFRSASYDAATDSVKLRLTRPLPRGGVAINLRVGAGLKAADGSNLQFVPLTESLAR